ncbi:MAG: hypothetical protein GWO87_01870 [Xanthomonadaceae bacterium]|nr:hypothetical protein [Rhodospirillaceae bacterium]NIA17917.1 hypothetical protein [Xanthomonadaceae bacterium]
MLIKKIIQNKILLYGLISETLYLSLFLIDGFFRKTFNDYSIHPKNPIILFFLFAVFGILFFLFIKIYKFIDRNGCDQKSFKIILLFFIIFLLTLIIIPPIGSSDIYCYMATNKALTDYHLNPFTTPASQSPAENTFVNLCSQDWANSTTVYGPVWHIILLPLGIIKTQNFFLNIISFKLLMVLFSALSLFLIYKILNIINPKLKYLGVILYAWNPFILFETANNAHNDIVMIFFILLFIYCLLKKKYVLATIFITFSILIKYISILLLPLFIIFLFKIPPTPFSKKGISKNKQKNALKEKTKIVLSNGFAFLFTLFIFYIPFLNNFSDFKKIIFHIINRSNLISFWYLSPFGYLIGLIYYLISFLNNSLINKYDIMLAIKNYSVFFFLITYIFILFFYIKEKNSVKNLIKYSAYIFIAYLLIANVWLMEWYLLWPLLLLIITDEKNYSLYFLITALALLSYPFSFIGSIIILIIFIFYFQLTEKLKLKLKNV